VGDKTGLGIAEIQTGQLPEAVANLQAALAERPNDPDLLYYIGRASGLLSKQSIDTLLAAYPDSPRAHQAMAENYFVLRQMPEAEKEYREALRLRPEIPEVHLELGEVYAGAFQWAKAEEEFRAQTKLQPGNAEAAYRLGTSLLEQGKAHEARTELRRADKLLPDMPETLYSLGKAASLEGDSRCCRKGMDPASFYREGNFACGAGAFRARRSLSETGKDGSRAARDAGVPEIAGRF
jgi:Flp pilus assembly protein TadD